MSALVYLSIKACVCDFLSESPLDTDTLIIRTLWHVRINGVPLYSLFAVGFSRHHLQKECGKNVGLAIWPRQWHPWKVKSVYEPNGSFRPKLIPVSVA